MKKILIIVTKAEVGGAQMSVLNLARELKKRGHKVMVGFGKGDFLAKELKNEEIKYYRFLNLKRTHNPLSGIYFIFELYNFLKNRSFDVVHFNSSNSLIGAIGVKLLFRKIKTVFTFRGMSVLDKNYNKNSFLKGFYLIYFKILMFFINTPVFISRRNLIDAKKIGLSDKGVLIYNGLKKEKINFLDKDEAILELEEKLKIKLTGKYIIGSIGRLHYQKNYEFLINNFRSILEKKKNAILVIIGEGSERRKLEKLISTKGLKDKVILAGRINEANRFLKSFDLFVLPSRYEGLSISLIEVLFANILALVSDVGGNNENFLSDNELYELDNREEFLQKFQRLQYDEIIEKAKESNRKQTDKFLIEKTAAGYEEIY